MRKKNNILFLIPSLHRAGAETQLVDLLVGCDEQKFQKSLAVFGHNLDQLDKIPQDRIKFFHIPRAYKFDVSIFRKLAAIIDEEEIEVIHCTLNVSVLVAWIARLFTSSKPKILAAVHTTINRSTKDEFWERLVYSKLFLRCDRVIFVCEKQAEHWYGKYPLLRGNSTYVHNGVDTQYFQSRSSTDEIKTHKASLGITDDSPVLCCIAAFRPEKGHLILLEAVSKLSSKPHLILAGDGPLRPDIEDKIKALNLSDRVHLLGIISDVRPVLELADVSVLASTAVETFSIAMLESMSMKVPVVCSDIGGLSEAVIPGKTGELVEIGSLEGLIEKLEAVLSDRNKLAEMSVSCRKMVDEKFGKDTMIEKTENHLKSLFSQTSSIHDRKN